MEASGLRACGSPDVTTLTSLAVYVGKMADDEDDVSRTVQWLIGGALTVMLGFSGWAAANISKIQDIDTRERLNSGSAENAIERVGAQADERIDKIDDNVQWLIKEFIAFRAEIRMRDQRQRERERDEQ